MTENKPDLLAMAADIVSAHVSKTATPPDEIPALIQRVHKALLDTQTGAAASTTPRPAPAVPIKKSITNDYIVCLEDGKKLKMLKRHLKAAYNLTPEQYRERWALPADYPMTAPNYAKKRSQLAKESGLGMTRKRKRGG